MADLKVGDKVTWHGYEGRQLDYRIGSITAIRETKAPYKPELELVADVQFESASGTTAIYLWALRLVEDNKKFVFPESLDKITAMSNQQNHNVVLTVGWLHQALELLHEWSKEYPNDPYLVRMSDNLIRRVSE